jgi:hypothetical protein
VVGAGEMDPSAGCEVVRKRLETGGQVPKRTRPWAGIVFGPQ